ncbi:hypothetical protein [Methylocystis parvus]|uniref:hypothetical protein n=1 Tax=Methylocystis parvus TaxID=134 RepID=UPI003C7115EE
MAVIRWPAQLPCSFLRDALSGAMPDSLLRAQMQTGPGKVRRRTATGVASLAGTLMLDFADRARLDRFYAEETLGGARVFSFPNPLAHNAPLLRADKTVITRADGTPLLVSSHLLVRFASAPQFASVGSSWRCSLALEVLP